MGDYLSTSLASAVSFTAGGLLTGTLAIKAPEDGEYYVLIEQYTSALAFMPGTREYLYQAIAGGVGVGDAINYTPYELDEDEEKEVSFSLSLAYTDCYLYLLLKKRAGGTPAPDTDDTVDYVVVTLTAPGELAIQLDINTIMNLMITMMIIVMMMKMMSGAMASA